MGQHKQNIGRDLTVSITLNGQVIQQFGLYSDTHIRPLYTERVVIPTNNGGLSVARPVFNGWEVDLSYYRRDGLADTLGQFCQDNYLAGNPDIDVSMQQTVRNDDGTVDTFVYINGIIYQTDAGSYLGTEDITGSFKLRFSLRQQITGAASDITYSGNGNLAA
jgi:hypothetical protein